MRYTLAVLVTYILFVNHWVRDSIGALEIPLESNATGYGMNPRQYNSLSSLYFLPNVVVPIVTGVLAQRTNAAAVLMSVLKLLFVGSALVATGALIADSIKVVPAHSDVPYGLTLAGRCLMGIAYEAIDMLGPFGMLAPLFTDKWPLIVGLVQGFNRAGSMMGFLLGPVLLASHGLAAAMLLPALLGMTALPVGYVARKFERRLRQRHCEEHAATATRDHPLARLPATSTSIGLAASSALTRDLADSAAAAAATGGSIVPGSAVSRDFEPRALAVARSRSAALRSARQGRLSWSDLTGGVKPKILRRDLSREFWLYVLGSGCAYGMMVPFWFVGSKHISVRWGYSLKAADAIMILPEGTIALTAPLASAIIHLSKARYVLHAVCVHAVIHPRPA